MADGPKQDSPSFKLPDPALFGRSMADVAERSAASPAAMRARSAAEGTGGAPGTVARFG